jgi:hypothetical protein
MTEGYEIEINAIIGLAKSNPEIKKYLVDSILREFGDDIDDFVFESGSLDFRYRDIGWRQPL